MDKKTRGKCVSALSRGFEARIARNNSLLPFTLYTHFPSTSTSRYLTASRHVLFA